VHLSPRNNGYGYLMVDSDIEHRSEESSRFYGGGLLFLTTSIRVAEMSNQNASNIPLGLLCS
jgi:hypothetical protein